MGRGRTTKVLTGRFDGHHVDRRPDELIVEEPLSIQLDDVTVSTTMRTPGNDFELAAGFCHTDGLLGGAPITAIRYCGTGPAAESEFNMVSVETGGAAPTPTPRLGTTSSSCGLCGTDAIHELRERIHPLRGTSPIAPEVLIGVPDAVVPLQDLFGATGSVHSAAAFTASGEPTVVREDIGRHNAIDKVVGRLLFDGHLPAGDMGLYVSGRASFEIVSKAWAAGFSAVVSVSAPSALAVTAARAANLTLAGFVRGGRLNLYSPEP